MSTAVTRYHLFLFLLGGAVVSLPFSKFLCHAFLILLVVTWITEGEWQRKYAVFKKHLILKILAIFLLIQFVGLSYSANAWSGLDSAVKKLLLLLVPLVLITSCLRLQPRHVRFLLALFVVSCTVASAICLGDAYIRMHAEPGSALFENFDYYNAKAYEHYTDHADRLWLFFSYQSLTHSIKLHPTFFAIYLVFCVTCILTVSEHYSGRIKVYTVCLVVYLAVFVTLLSSRLGWIALLLTFVMFASRYVIKQNRYAMGGVVIAVFVLISVMFFVNPVSRYRMHQEVFASPVKIQALNETSTQIRASLFYVGLKTFLQGNLLMGGGTGSARHKMAATGEQVNVANILGSHDPHNQFLHSLIENGAPGFIVLVLMIVVPLIQAVKQKRYLLLHFNILIGLLFLTESALELQKGIGFFSIFFGLLYYDTSENGQAAHKFSFYANRG